MHKFLLIPDSFKGTMSSMEICAIMKDKIEAYYPGSEIISLPVADGGEGSVDSFLQASGGDRIRVKVHGPYQEEIDSFYGILPDKVAIIEMAAAASLPMVDGRQNPMKTTTYGVGELIMDAKQKGCKKIIVGLGGSCTNDAGCGAAAACGVVFKDKEGKSFIPVGGTLADVASIDNSKLKKDFEGITIITMCDIDNPFAGKNGAAYIFGPQKGADEKMVEELDRQMQKIEKVINRDCGLDVSFIPGAGAAGGMGGGMAAFFSSHLQMGIETVLDTVHFDSLLAGTDLVLTGEGKIDTQSLRGKVVIGVARRAKKQDVPVVAIVGDIGDDIDKAYEIGVSGIFSTNRVAVPFKDAKKRAGSDMMLTVDNLMRFLKRMGK